ncbi:MAG: type III pantothenate kinase [Pyrinomonadaceae bacterium]
MLLAVDIGNSSIKFGVFDGETLHSKFSIATQRGSTADQLREAVENRLEFPISSAIMCSVVPKLEAPLRTFLKTSYAVDPFIVKNNLDFGLKIHYQPLEAAGTDRIVNCFAAAEKYGVPCIVCSFGTATTIDVVDDAREMLGGLIAVGLFASAKALHQQTAQLPEVEIREPESVIGHTTETSIQSGIFYSQIGLVESVVARFKNQIGDNLKVIATGGFASMIAKNTDVIDVVDENLLLDGLRVLAHRN